MPLGNREGARTAKPQVRRPAGKTKMKPVSTEGDMTTKTISSSITLSQRIAAGLACFFVGSFLVFGVGLAQDDRMHNAAHDTRHAIGFPCH
jgi:cobalt transporter subunit CbtB